MRARAKLGRPPLAEGKAKAAMFTIRLAPDERAAIERASKARGMRASQWAREVLLLASRGDNDISAK